MRIFVLFCFFVLSVQYILGQNLQLEIKSNIDLKEDTLFLPSGSVLKIKGGLLSNGTIVGNNTRIESEKQLIFKNIKILGTWTISSIYTNWFDFSSTDDNYNNFQNLLALSDDSIHNDIYFEKKKFYTSKQNHLLKVKSNTVLHLDESIIEILPNSDQSYSVISIRGVKNVQVLGGKLIGDIHGHKILSGTTDEWNHGIIISGSENVIVRHTISTCHMGDGVDIIDLTHEDKSVRICKNIVLDGVICKYNRRQAFSIEAVDGLIMRNCRGLYTGKIKYTAPGLGLDIEPWRKESVCKNIDIKDCEFTENGAVDQNGNRIDVIIQPNHLHQKYDSIVNNILLLNCKLSGILSAYYVNGLFLDSLVMPKESFIGVSKLANLKLSRIQNIRKVYFEEVAQALLSNTTFQSFQALNSHNIRLENSSVSKINITDASNLVFTGCRFEDKNVAFDATSYFSGCKYIDFINCRIGQYINTFKCDFTKLSFIKCKFQLDRRNTREYRLHNVSNIEQCMFDMPVELVIENSPSTSAVLYANLWNSHYKKKVAVRVHNNSDAKLYFLDNDIYDSQAAVGVDFGSEQIYYYSKQNIPSSLRIISNLQKIQLNKKDQSYSNKAEKIRKHPQLGYWQKWDGALWKDIK